MAVAASKRAADRSVWIAPGNIGARERASPIAKDAENMLSREDNETLCRVGPGTRMGKVMRRYWHPIATSAQLPEPDCAPLRTKLLGEQICRLSRHHR